MRFRDISITTKLLLASGSILLFLSLITVVCWLRFGSVVTELDHADYSTQLNKEILAKEIDHLKFMNQAGRFFSDPSQKSMQVETDDHKCPLGKWLYGSERQAAEKNTPSLAPLLQKLEQPHARLHDSVKQINALAATQEKNAILPEAQKIFEGSTKSAMTEMETALHDILAAIQADSTADHNKADASIMSSRNLILLFAVISIGLGLIISFVISRSISRSTQQLAAMTDNLAKGNMTTRSQLNQQDEIGRLACPPTTSPQASTTCVPGFTVRPRPSTPPPRISTSSP